MKFRNFGREVCRRALLFVLWGDLSFFSVLLRFNMWAQIIFLFRCIIPPVLYAVYGKVHAIKSHVLLIRKKLAWLTSFFAVCFNHCGSSCGKRIGSDEEIGTL